MLFLCSFSNQRDVLIHYKQNINWCALTPNHIPLIKRKGVNFFITTRFFTPWDRRYIDLIMLQISSYGHSIKQNISLTKDTQQGRAWGQNQSTQGVGMGGGEGVSPSHTLGKKIKIWTKWWLLLHFLNLNTDLIVSKTKVKNSQNPIALVQDYY